MIQKFLSTPLLLFLIPLSFVSGIVVTETLLFFCIIILIISNKDKFLYLDSKIIFLFIFSIYIFFNSLIQITGESSKNLRLSSLVYFRYVIFSVSIVYLCEIFEVVKKKKYFLILVFGILIIMVDSIFQFFYGANLLGYEANYSRISGFFKDELILGSFLVRVFPIILFFIFFFKLDIEKYNYYLIFFFSLYLITIYISAGRTAFFLSLIVFTTIILIFKSLRKITIYSILILIFFSAITTYYDLGKTNPSNRIFTKTYNQIFEEEKNLGKFDNKIEKKNIFNIYSIDHNGHIILAIKLFIENKIFGVGPKGFRKYCREVNYNPKVGICTTHPHNISIQILSELGLIGFFFYVSAFLFIIFNFLKSLYRRNFDRNFLSFYSITIGLIINIFPLIPGGNFFNNWISIFLYYNIGIYIYSYKKCILR